MPPLCPLPLLLATLATLAGLALTGCDSNRITPENVALLRPGLPTSGVKKVLGERNVSTFTGAKFQTFQYRADKLWVSVECRGGKVYKISTRDPARVIPAQARLDLPVLVINAGAVMPEMDAALRTGGIDALAAWVKKELVPGRPVRLSTGKEVVVGDRCVVPRDADDLYDYDRAIVPPGTDEYIWYTAFSTGFTTSYNDHQPPVSVVLFVTR